LQEVHITEKADNSNVYLTAADKKISLAHTPWHHVQKLLKSSQAFTCNFLLLKLKQNIQRKPKNIEAAKLTDLKSKFSVETIALSFQLTKKYRGILPGKFI